MADKGVRRRPCCILLVFLIMIIAITIFIPSLYSMRKFSSMEDIRADSYQSVRQNRNRARRPHGSILVTGGAGFIGFHTALRLVTEKKWKEVVVIDNFNSYYNVGLKEKRASILLQQGVIVHRTDLCNERFLRHLFATHKFTAVVHMAAQAGVSQSLLNPLVYVQANIACLTVLLDVLTDHKDTLLVYASSSSVYGQSSALPFSPLAPLSPPTNMYAALKQAGEQLVSGYCSDHGLLAVGLRFFTVYGPWGRPDMAVFKFASKILAGDTVVLYEHDSRSVQRDFTYISDIVDCVVLALSHTPASCNEVYNVGRGQPEQLQTLLNYLEKELSKTATLEVQPLPLSELPLTQADISLTKIMLGYQPKIDLETGVKLFVEWFVEYNHSSKQENEKEEDLLQASQKLTHSVQSSLDQKWTSSMNQAYEKKIAAMRAKYIEFAKSKKIQLPNISQKTFTFHPGVDSPGGTIMKAVGLSGTHKIPMLEAKCRDTEQCLAFNSRGDIKTRIQPKTAWVNVSKDDGLYIANVDVCAADLHECPLDATCLRTGSSQYSCLCKEDQIKLGKQCLDIYSPKRRSEVETVQLLADQLDGVDWKGIVNGAQLVFFQGMDTPGGDYLYTANAADDVTKLTKSCLKTHRCIAFNTNGLLKHSVQPPNKWIHWTKNSHKGLYVLDVDYCSLAHDRCPSHSSCVKHAPANYSCTCHPPRSWDSTTDSCVLPHTASNTVIAANTAKLVHVVVSVDSDHFPGLLALISSIQEYTVATQQVHVHVVISNDLPKTVENLLDCITLQKNIKVAVVYFESTKLQGLVKVTAKREMVGNLASGANFARFFFHELFPSLSHILYLDADTVVRADVTPLWDQLIQSDQLVIAVPRNKPKYKEMFRSEVDSLYYQRYGTRLQQDTPTFNAGVYGVNLAMWRKEGVHNEILYWMKQHMNKSLWQLGTQPLLLLVAHGRWEPTDKRWNINGLGWKTTLSHQLLTEAFILHWSGRRKPWLPDGLYRQYWKSHYPKQCSAQYQY